MKLSEIAGQLAFLNQDSCFDYIYYNGEQVASTRGLREKSDIEKLVDLYKFCCTNDNTLTRDLTPKELFYLFILLYQKRADNAPEENIVLNKLKTSIEKIYNPAKQLADAKQLTWKRFNDLITSPSWWMQLRFHCFWKWQRSKSPLPTLPKVHDTRTIYEDARIATTPKKAVFKPVIVPQPSVTRPLRFSKDMSKHQQIAAKYGYKTQPKPLRKRIN